MTRLGPKLRQSGGAATVAFAAALLLWAAATQHHRLTAPPASIYGTYKVRVVGYGAGAGSCTVNPTGVDVDCQIADDRGNQQHLQASDLDLDGYRFHGTGTLGGVPVRIAGRVDPPDAAAAHKPRFSATFLASDGRAARIVGTHQ